MGLIMRKIIDAIKWFFLKENNEGGLMPFLKGFFVLLAFAATAVSAINAIKDGGFLTICGIVTLAVAVGLFVKVMNWIK